MSCIFVHGKEGNFSYLSVKAVTDKDKKWKKIIYIGSYVNRNLLYKKKGYQPGVPRCLKSETAGMWT